MADDLEFDLTEAQQGPAEHPDLEQPPIDSVVESPDDDSSESASESAPTEGDRQAAEPPSQAQAPEDSDKPQDMVPHAALHEEREKRKELDGQVRRMEERFSEFLGRVKAEQEVRDQTAQAAQAPQVPEFDDDPAANLDQRLKAQEQAQATSQEQVQAQMHEQQQRNQINAFEREFQSKEQAFASKTPDYYQATEFLRDSRLNELKTLGYPEAQARQVLDAEALQYAITATNNGVDPVEMFYKVARERGYKAGAGPNGTPTQVDLKTLQANIERADSMGSRGGTPRESLSLAELSNMSENEFDEATSGDKWEELWT